MTHFSFILVDPGNDKRDELAGDYADVDHAISEAKRFLFDVSHEILARSASGSIRIEVRDTPGRVVFEASLHYRTT